MAASGPSAPVGGSIAWGNRSCWNLALTESDELRPAEEAELPLGLPGPMVASQLFAVVGDIQFELRSFKAHQHTAKLVPGELPPIDHEKRNPAVTIAVPFNPAVHYSIRDLWPVFGVSEMF